MFKLIEETKLKEWETQHSSLAKKAKSATYEQCRLGFLFLLF